MKTTKSHQSLVFTNEELSEINEMRKVYEEMSDREKFLVCEAFRPYIK